MLHTYAANPCDDLNQAFLFPFQLGVLSVKITWEIWPKISASKKNLLTLPPPGGQASGWTYRTRANFKVYVAKTAWTFGL